jgi:hypothetical protein
MLNRREFLATAAGGVVTLLLTPVISACGSDSSSGTTSSTTNSTTPGCDGAGETSTVSLGHTHSLCVPASDLDSPSAAGATYLTSSTEGHQHMVTLTQAWLMAVASGAKVMVTTSTMDGHTHDFAVQRVAATVTLPPSSPPVTGPYD